MNRSVTFLAVLLAATIAISGCKKENTSPTNAIELSGEVNIDSVLSNRKAAPVDYIVSGTLFLNAKVRIMPGTVIHLKEGATVQVNANGALVAWGSASERITLTAVSGAKWNALIFYSQSDSNKLHYCDIKNGGRGSITNPAAMVIVGQNAYAEGKVSIRDCVFEASAGSGLFINDRSSVTDFHNNAFNSNTDFPITVTSENVSDVNATSTFSANGKNYVEIRDCVYPVGKNQTFAKLTVPYYIGGNVSLYGNDTIKAGVSFVFGSSAALIADNFNANNRSLTVQGTAGSPVVFNSENSSGWQSLTIRGSAYSAINYAEFKNAGNVANQYGQQAAVIVENAGANVSIRDCVFDNSGGYGIDLGGCTNYNSDIATANSFVNCASGNVKY
ncbi:MAG: hypothetical protein KIS94_09070 [Chitinophagales bacterium]|nr:hypothetical protein [Chitinophagales bacterium]